MTTTDVMPDNCMKVDDEGVVAYVPGLVVLQTALQASLQLAFAVVESVCASFSCY